MECEYGKYGCVTRISSADHLQAHYHYNATSHLKLLYNALDSEINENKSLNQKVQQLTKAVKDLDVKVGEYESKFKEYDSKINELLKAGSSASYKAPASQAPVASSQPASSTNRIDTKERDSRMSQSQPSLFRSSSSSISPVVPAPSPVPAAASVPAVKVSSPAPGASKVIEITGALEKGILWGYNAVSDEWTRSLVTYTMEKNSFAQGALRAAHKTEIKSVVGPADSPPEPAVAADKNIKSGMPTGLNLFGDKYASKVSMKPCPAERYFEDVRMQAICAELGTKFNQRGMPKPIQFLPCWVLELPKGGYCGLEPFIEGEFIKLNTNYGGVLSERNTPQAFSHFSWEQSNHTMLVIDLQGVKDYYTDPQVHTKDGKGFGLGNLGMGGVDRFLKNHKCNAICQQLALPLLGVQDLSAKKKNTAQFRGTMKVPFIEDLLGTDTAVKWEGPNLSKGGEFQCVQTLSGHDDRVVSLCLGGKYLFSGTYDGTIKAWNINTLALESTINAHRKSVESMCCNAVNLFSASADQSIKVWDLNNLECAVTLRDHIGEVNALCLTDKTLGFLISASFDKNIKVWNIRNWKCQHNLEGHTKAIKALCVSGAILFSASNDGAIMVWNLKYMSCLFTIDGHESWVKALVVRDKSLYSGAFDYLVKEWDITTFNNTATLSEHNDDVLALLSTDKFLVSASQDRAIIFWDYVTKKPIASIKGHRSGVQALATDGKLIFSGADDCTVKVWKWVG